MSVAETMKNHELMGFSATFHSNMPPYCNTGTVFACNLDVMDDRLSSVNPISALNSK